MATYSRIFAWRIPWTEEPGRLQSTGSYSIGHSWSDLAHTPDLRNLYAGQEATVRTRHGPTDWFQVGKGYVKTVYCHPTHLTYMQSTSCEMPGWMKHKLESRWLEETSITLDMQMIHPYGWKWRTKEPLDESERGERKGWLKAQHSNKLRSWHLVPLLHANRQGNNGNSERLYFGGP